MATSRLVHCREQVDVAAFEFLAPELKKTKPNSFEEQSALTAVIGDQLY
jgi:hypothetical protein